MREKKLYRVLVISLGITLLVAGIYLGMQLSDNQKSDDNQTAQVVNNVDNSNENPTVEVYSDKNDKKTDIDLVYEDYYIITNEVVTNADTVYGVSINELKKQEEDKNSKANNGYELVEQGDTRLVFRKEINEYGPEHYNVKLEGEKIVVYRIIKDDKTEVYKEVEVPESSLRPELIEELNKGIRIDSKNDLNLLMEDLES